MLRGGKQQVYFTPVLWDADANKLQISKMATKRFITTLERLLSISTLHWTQVGDFSAKLTWCPVLSVSSWYTDTVSKMWALGILHVC